LPLGLGASGTTIVMMAFMVDTEDQTMRAPVGLAIILYVELPKPLKKPMCIFTTHLFNNTNVLLQSRHSCPWPAMLIMMGLCAGSTKLDYGAF
jgi:hypothetical protein